MRSLRSLATLGLAVLTTACASPSPGAANRDAEPGPIATAPATTVPTKPPAEPSTRATPKPVETTITKSPAPPLLGRDHHSAVACTADADCGWNDPCMPTRCVEAQTTDIACDESGPPPGTCSCLEGACTLKPHTPPPPTGTCEPRACMVDRAAGKCVADDGGVAEGIRSSTPVEVGPSCDCIVPAEGCVFHWFEPVPCKTDRDCWVDPSPRRHPVPRPRALRRRDFRPCADGEVPPKCGPAGRCVLGPGYSC